MTAAAKTLRNQRYKWGYRRTPDGYEGVRYYLVNTTDPVDAAGATSLPAMGDGWGGAAPSLLVVTDYDFEYYGGRDNAGDNNRTGWTVVRVTYRTPGDTPFRAVGSWCEIKPAVQQVKLSYDVRFNTVGAPTETKEPINNGEGIQVDVGYTAIIVHRVLTSGDFSDALIDKLEALQHGQKVNSDAVTLPKILNISGLTPMRAAGRLRFHLWQPQERPVTDGLVEYTITLLSSDTNHDYTEFRRNKYNEATATSRTRKAYNAASFNGATPYIW